MALKFLLGALFLGDVLYRAQGPGQFFVHIKRQFGVTMHPARLGAQQNAVLDVIRRTLKRHLPCSIHRLPVLAMDALQKQLIAERDARRHPIDAREFR